MCHVSRYARPGVILVDAGWSVDVPSVTDNGHIVVTGGVGFGS